MTETPEPPADAASGADDTIGGEVGIDDVLADQAEERHEVGATGDDRSGVRPSALTSREANTLASRRRPTVLVLAGGVACGKTSAYAALYERLGRGSFAGRLFAGSATISGFEARCYHWRKSSALSDKWMRRTQRSDLPWLHIRLRDLELEHPVQEMLLGDFDGEVFNQLINNEVQAAELPFLRRADHVGVVIDGSKLASAAQRPSEREDVLNLIRELHDDPAAAPASSILVVTKVDLLDEITDPEDKAAIAAVISDAEEALRVATQRRPPVVRLAVRSESDRFPLGHGLEDLLEILWVRDATYVESPPPAIAPTNALERFRA